VVSESRRPAGALEAEVLATLWAAATPLTAAQVRDSLGGDLAYTTVMTILTRLHDKAVVERHRSGRAYAYAPVLDQAGIAAAQMRALLDHGADRASVLALFVDGLSGEDERVLTGLIRRAERTDGPS
jgi:predicted transcriptional regulator